MRKVDELGEIIRDIDCAIAESTETIRRLLAARERAVRIRKREWKRAERARKAA